MADIDQLLEQIAQAPAGPTVLAIFDFDGTVIAGYSAMLFLREQVQNKHLSADALVQLVKAMFGFARGKTSFSKLMLENALLMRSVSEQTYIDLGEDVFKKHIAHRIYPESRALIEAHQRKGHTVAIITSATPYQVMPAARELGVEHVMCSHMKVEDGKFTGGIVRPLCFGEGKVIAAESLAKQTGGDFDCSFFYSDSQDDLQLLERIKQPVALNPTSELQEIAEQRGWPIARFDSRGRPGLGGYLRSLAAMVSVIGTTAAGLPLLALTGSRREAQNFSFSLFGDLASALIKLNLDVKGEHHLWEQRPAVFVFNHQSKADSIITSKLLRRDVAGVGKKEIRDLPILGRIIEFTGMVFVDRANSANAVEAMRPLVDAIREDGKSVVMAPEGTRSTLGHLGAFKKGAFHLAMQAGVPIVPIVIHNSVDIAPKGEFVFRPGTVRVDVLPPVDTSHWRPEDIADHVAEVRSMFLSALGQTAAESADHSKKEDKSSAGIAATAKPRRKPSATGGARSQAKSSGKKATARS